MRHRFQVSTNRTGIHRRVVVLLYDTIEELRDAEARIYSEPVDDSTAAFFQIPDDWVDRDPRPSVGGRLHLCREYIDATLIAHEATHIGLHIYSVDGYREHARASAHLHGHNEAVAYLVGDLVSAIGMGVQRAGVDLQIGRGRHYQSPAYPGVIPRDTPI